LIGPPAVAGETLVKPAVGKGVKGLRQGLPIRLQDRIQAQELGNIVNADGVGKGRITGGKTVLERGPSRRRHQAFMGIIKQLLVEPVKMLQAGFLIDGSTA
jgi:hypothetical protein